MPDHELYSTHPLLDYDARGSEVLLPFVAGMVLAYLLDPLANRIERLGMNRLLATLVIMTLAITAITLLIVLTVPVRS